MAPEPGSMNEAEGVVLPADCQTGVPDAADMVPRTFAELGCDAQIQEGIGKMGFQAPTLVQLATIPYLLRGADVMGQAHTGTGKTAAFGIPLLMRVPADGKGPVGGLVLCPTRELACQVADEVGRIGSCKPHKIAAIYGGAPMDKQIRALEDGAHIVVGTPGRVMDLVRRGLLQLGRVRYAVLDEADEMLDMGFIDDIRWILRKTPTSRQTMLFSATMSRQVRRLAEFHMHRPRYLDLSGEQLTRGHTTQLFYEVPEGRRFEALCSLIDHHRVGLGLVFCRTRRDTDLTGSRLRQRGFDAYAIHGDLPQGERMRIMQKFRDRSLHLLVATDVAARGIDVSNVTHVINYQLPMDPELYVHRIGRTGRMGAVGTALTLVGPQDYHDLYNIQEKLDIQLEQRQLPDEEEILANRRASQLRELMARLEGQDLSSYRRLFDEVEAYVDVKDAAAALFKIATEGLGTARAQPEPRYEEEEKSEEKIGATEAVAPAAPIRFGNTGAEQAGMVRFHVSVGRRDGVSPEAMVDAVAKAVELTPERFVRVRMHEDFSFLEVPETDAYKVAEVGRKPIPVAGRECTLEPAKPRGPSHDGPRRQREDYGRPSGDRVPMSRSGGGRRGGGAGGRRRGPGGFAPGR